MTPLPMAVRIRSASNGLSTQVAAEQLRHHRLDDLAMVALAAVRGALEPVALPGVVERLPTTQVLDADLVGHLRPGHAVRAAAAAGPAGPGRLMVDRDRALVDVDVDAADRVDEVRHAVEAEQHARVELLDAGVVADRLEGELEALAGCRTRRRAPSSRSVIAWVSLVRDAPEPDGANAGMLTRRSRGSEVR